MSKSKLTASVFFSSAYGPIKRTDKAPGRNDPCFCGSKKKYKRCCLLKEQAAIATILREAQRRIDAKAKDKIRITNG